MNRHQPPPRLATYLLRRLVAPHRLDELEEDLDELFQQRVQAEGLRTARWRYVRDVLSLLRPALMKREETLYAKPTTTDMIRNYLKIAFRNLAKNKSYSAINIAGLAVGMAVAMLIGIWINDERSANRHHKNYETLYQVKMHQTFDGHRGTQDAIPFPLGDELRTKYPDFKAVAMYQLSTDTRTLAVGDQKFLKKGNYIGPDAVDMFSLPVLNGAKNPLKEPYSIVLTDETAQAVFGDQDPIDKIVRIDNSFDVKVTAVVAKQPANATLQFDYLLPWHLQEARNESMRTQAKTDWKNNDASVFVQLKEGVDPAQTNAKIKDVVLAHLSDDPTMKRLVKPEVFLHPMAKWRLYSDFTDGKNTGGFIKYVRLFGVFGLFILVIACINFMNLSTARSEKRAKEVGVRKAVGSGRKQLIGQFLSESILTAGLALVVALILVFVSLPSFNRLTERAVAVDLSNPAFWGVALLFTLFTGLMAGSYPALYLSSFNPVKILKGGVHVGKSATLPRKVLVVVQFTFSVSLMIGTIIIYQQLQHGKNRPLGFAKAGLLSVNSTPNLLSHMDALRDELVATGAVSSICQTNAPPTQWWSNNSGWEWKGAGPNDKSVIFTTLATTYDYTKTMGINIKEGRDFSRDFPSDSTGSVLLNEAAVKRTGLKNPIGERLKWANREWTVVGVIPDIVMEWSPYREVAPMTVLFDKNWVSFIDVRINPAMAPSVAIDKIRPIFDKYNPGFPFDYKFADTEYAKKFHYEELIGNLSAIICLLAIFISCLGLFGLASFLAEQRTKEIGVRKVLGASITNLWGLLSKDFVQLVLIACLVASPIAWYAMNRWLEDYIYKITIHAGVFVAVLALALLITLLTVSYQAIKAALMNPVKSLRSE